MAQAELTLTNNRSWPVQGEWTYQDYLDLPDDGRRYEIIAGVLYMNAAPSYDHQYIVAEIFGELRNFVRVKQLGVLLTAPFEVHLSETSRPLQPDILFIRAENQPAPGAAFFAGAPDLVVEVLSPGSLRTDRYVKFAAYERAGVPEYWLVDPKTRSLEVFTLSDGEYTLLGQFIGNEVAQSKIFVGVEITVGNLFPPTRPA